jgi:hypothetical protein
MIYAYLNIKPHSPTLPYIVSGRLDKVVEKALNDGWNKKTIKNNIKIKMLKDIDCRTEFGRAFYNGEQAKEIKNLPERDIEEEDKRRDEAQDMDNDERSEAEEEMKGE